jgi:hypothetical protein
MQSENNLFILAFSILNFARKIKIFGNAAENQFFFKLKKDMVWK